MSKPLFPTFRQPWFLYLCSFILMTGFACPMYRRKDPVGLLEYGFDSMIWAIGMAGVVAAPLGYLVWLIALVMLFAGGRTRSLFMLGVLWLLYCMGWFFFHIRVGT